MEELKKSTYSNNIYCLKELLTLPHVDCYVVFVFRRTSIDEHTYSRMLGNVCPLIV